ncbi:MAG: ATP-binding cassette domain-containing protein [Congregibacter sp.]
MSQESQRGGLGERLLNLFPGGRTRADKSPLPWKRLNLEIPSETPSQLLLIAAIAALCGTGVLYILNAEAKEIEQQGYSVLRAALFPALLVIYRISQLTLIRRASSAVEAALDNKRRRGVELLLSLSLRDMEGLDRQTIRDGLSAHYGALSQSLVPLVSGVESLILLVFMFGYLLTLSMAAGGITIVVMSVTILGYLNHHEKMQSALNAAATSETLFRSQTEGIIGGAKELQLNLQRRSDLQVAMEKSSSGLSESRENAAWFFADLIATGTSISYFLAGVIVFVLPILSTEDTENLSQVVIAIIFILGPIGSLVQTLQHASTAQFSLTEINNFEDKLQGLALYGEATNGEHTEDFSHFKTLSLDRVEYRHDGEKSFAISDISLVLKRGEITFLTGGNGSGKTTLLRVMTGLYPRSQGAIAVDDTVLPNAVPQSYRDLFASVFSDFYLFDGPYGLSESQLPILDKWLTTLRVREKLGGDLTAIQGDQLSTGQRKRVALGLALTENRPVLVLDEWAADQDPETRQWFYETLLPELKENGITLFVITHDEHYFDCCDRRLHMVEGRLTEEALS